MTTAHWKALFQTALFLLALAAASANATNVTFNYTGNQFNPAASSADNLGRHLSASVTFLDSVQNLTGEVDGSAIVAWSIEVAGVPATHVDSSTGANNADWPLWFKFLDGNIVGWQLLAQQSLSQFFPEIYTTSQSPYARIAPTADFYVKDVNSSSIAYIQDLPGTWSPVPLPAGFSLLTSSLIVIAIALRRSNRRIDS